MLSSAQTKAELASQGAVAQAAMALRLRQSVGAAHGQAVQPGITPDAFNGQMQQAMQMRAQLMQQMGQGNVADTAGGQGSTGYLQEPQQQQQQQQQATVLLATPLPDPGVLRESTNFDSYALNMAPISTDTSYGAQGGGMVTSDVENYYRS